MKQKYLILFSLSGLILSADQLLKHLVQMAAHSQQVIENGFEKVLIPGALSVVLRYNKGFALGLFDRPHQQIQELLYLVIPVFAIILIVLIFIKLQDNQMLTSIALTGILSGAVSNLMDRIKYGYVVDFLRFQIGSRWELSPINIADISIFVGVIIMFFATFKKGKR